MRQNFYTYLLFLFFVVAFSTKGQTQSCINLIGEPVSGNPGDTIEVEFSTLNFDDCLGLGFYLKWDESVLEFYDVEHLLPVQAQSTFNNYASGKLAFAWYSEDLITPYSYPNDTYLITIKFIVVGDNGDATQIAFDRLTGVVPNSFVLPGPEEIHFQGFASPVTIGEPPVTLMASACNEAPFNCLSSGAIDVTIEGGSGIPPYSFNWTGPGGFTSNEEDITNPVVGEYELTVTDQGGEERVALLFLDTLISPNCVSECANLVGHSVSGNPGDTVQVDFTTQNFNDFIAMELRLQWDTSLIELYDQTNTLPSGADYVNGFNLTEADKLLLIWVDLSLVPSSLVNGETLLSLHFIIKGDIGEEAHVGINLEESFLNVDDKPFRFQGINPSVSIGIPENTIDLFACNSSVIDCVNDGIIDLLVSGGSPQYSFNWTGPAGFSSMEQNITSSTPGVYELTVTDQNGRERTAALFIDSLNTDNFTAELSYDCVFLDKVNVTAAITGNSPTQNYTFDWGSQGGIFTDPYSSSLNNVSASTAYTVTVTGENNCQEIIGPLTPDCAATSDANCFLIKAPVKNLGPGENCIPVYANGLSDIDFLSFSMDWPGLKHFENIDIGPNTFLLNNMSLDSSELNNGKLGFTCMLTSDETFPDDVFLFDVCFDRDEFTDTLSDFSFAGDVPVKASAQVQGIELGFRYINGKITQTVNPISIWNISDGCVDVTSCAPLTASIDITIDGGTGPFDYIWTGPGGFTAMTEDVSSQALMAGFYTVTVTDLSDNSERTAGFEVLASDPVSQGHYIDNVNCFGSATGSIEVAYIGFFGPLTYQWSSGEDSSYIENLSAGIYTVTVSNGIACDVVQEFMVNEPSAILADAIGECANPGMSDGALSLNISGGIAPFSISWSDTDTVFTSQRDSLAAGNYQVTITDAASCILEVNDLIVLAGDALKLIDSTNLCFGDSINLFQNIPIGAMLTNLSTMEGISCNPCVPPFKVSPSQTTEYKVTMEGDGCVFFDSTVIHIVDSCVWPGDTDLSKEVDHFDLLNIGLAHGSTGPLRPNASIVWSGQSSPNWMESTPNSNINYKHIDADGNGLIEDMDTLAIIQNWGEIHNLTEGFESRHPDLPFATLTSGDGIPFYIEVDTLEENAVYNLPVILGEDANPAEDVYGIAFSLDYDQSVIVPGSAFLTFENSWLAPQTELLYIQRADIANGRIDIAMTRRDGFSQDGFGQVASFNITIEDDIFFTSTPQSGFAGDDQEIIFDIKDVRIINHKEEEILAETKMTKGTISTDLNETWLEQQIEIFPNPAQTEFWVRSKGIKMDLLTLFNAAGEKIIEWQPKADTLKVPCGDLAQGVYWLRISTEKGIAMERLMIVH